MPEGGGSEAGTSRALPVVVPCRTLHRAAHGAATRPLPGEIARALAVRGFDAARRAGEEPEAHCARLETALMALFRDGRSEGAFQALYEHSLPAVRRGVGSSLRGLPRGADLLELVQDVYVNVYRYAGSFRDDHPKSFRAWVATICANVVRRHMSQRARPSLQDLPDPLQEPADPAAGPDGRVLALEQERCISGAWLILLLHYAAAWRELSPRDRLALELVEVHGLTYAEACLRLRVGMSNMKMIMFRARKRIRARIGRAMDDAPQAERRLAG